MKFECYRHWDQLPAGADALFECAENESVFLTREWFETLYQETVDDGQMLLLASVVDGSQLLALLPLIEDRAESLRAFSHRYTAFYSLLLAEQNSSAIVACLAEGLIRKPVYALQLSPVAEDDINLLGLQRQLDSCGYESQHQFFFYNWIYLTNGESFDDYMAERPAQLRNTIARKQRKLEREHNSDIKLYASDDVQQGLKDYHSAYSASWKANEQYVDLFDALAINMSRRGWARLAVLYIDGQAAAAQIWFVVKGKASIFRLAYDEQWKRYSPGSILTAYLMAYVIDVDRVQEIDFLTGNETYKQDWMNHRRQRSRLLLVKPKASQSNPAGLKGLFKKVFGSCTG